MAHTRIGRVLRTVHHAVFHASRDARSAEIVGWSNALAAITLGAGAFLAARSWPVAGIAAVVAFVMLRIALAHRLTVWLAAGLGTTMVALLAGGLAWTFAHVAEMPRLPEIAGALVALAAGVVPARAYRRVAERRRAEIRDSLIDPVSVPLSR